MTDPDIISALVGKTPKDWVHDGVALMALAALAGRAWHAFKTGGGLSGIWRALLYGTNTPKDLPSQSAEKSADKQPTDSNEKQSS